MSFPPANSSSLSFLLLLLFAAAAFTAATTALPTEKMTHLSFYFHDIRAGIDQTSYVITGLNKSASSMSEQFGNIGVFDNALTKGPELTSKLVGRGQGLVVNVGLSGQVIMTSLNFVFTEGKYKGCSLAMYGRADLTSRAPSERPIIGGSGRLRLARGFSVSKVVKYSPGYVLGKFDIYLIPRL